MLFLFCLWCDVHEDQGVRDVLFRLVLFTYMVPTAVTYIPCYIILSRLGLLDTEQLPGTYLSNASVLGIFSVRQGI